MSKRTGEWTIRKRKKEKTKKGGGERGQQRDSQMREWEHENMAHGGVKVRTEYAKSERIKGKSEARADRQEHVRTDKSTCAKSQQASLTNRNKENRQHSNDMQHTESTRNQRE